MKDWNTLQPDVVKLLNKNFTKGRGGQKIDKVVIHHNAGVLTIDQIWQVWQTRQASAHYQVETGGRIGQLVWDNDTAWHAANQHINQTSIGLEFANSAGAGADWPITDKTIEEGAHLTAAICKYYKLGRPQAGKNVRFHREFTSTTCPYHLAPGGKYHNTLMSRAQYWYDQMTSPQGASSKGEEDMAFGSEQVAALNDAKVAAQQSLVIARSNAARLKNLEDQILGPKQEDRRPEDRNPKGGRGWSQLGSNAQGLWLTLIDSVAALRQDVAELMKEDRDGK